MQAPPIEHKFGRWTTLSVHETGKKWPRVLLCRCDCGAVKPVYEQNLKRGLSISCGCWNKDHPPRKTHGHTHGRKLTPEYQVWRGMLQRCEDPKNISYPNYGARGIIVCERWHKFENFFADMGKRPEGLTLDRKETNGNYERDNCKWSDWSTQCKGRRPKTAEHRRKIAEARRKTICKRGHPMTEENVLFHKRPGGRADRYCRLCSKERRKP